MRKEFLGCELRDKELLSVVERFSRLLLLKEVGVNGLSKLRKAKVVIVGCGATGSHIAELLVRSGVRNLRLIDGDYVDEKNLYRTTLFTEEDAAKALPKAVACANRLRLIDHSVMAEPVVDRLTSSNVEELLKGFDIIVDGTDNFLTRFLINDYSVKHGIPWVMSGVEQWYGNVWLIHPVGSNPCLRCVFPKLPETVGNACNILGVLPTAVTMAATISATLVIKHVLGLGGEEGLERTLYTFDLKRSDFYKVRVTKNPSCEVCVHKKFRYLSNDFSHEVAQPICGTRAVEITPPQKIRLNLKALANKIKVGRVLAVSEYSVKVKVTPEISVVVFSNGRAIVDGITDVAKALTIYEAVTGIKLRDS